MKARQSCAGRPPPVTRPSPVVVVAQPDAGDEFGAPAKEPSVAKVLAGAGLAGDRPAETGGAAGSGFHRRYQHIGDFGGRQERESTRPAPDPGRL